MATESEDQSSERHAQTVLLVERVAVLTEDQIQKGYNAAEIAGVRIDKHAAYADWSAMVKALPAPPDNPVGHWIEFCRKRARELR